MNSQCPVCLGRIASHLFNGHMSNHSKEEIVAAPPATMLTTVGQCLRMISAKFGFDSVTPEFHWVLHFPSRLRKIQEHVELLLF